MSGFFKNYFSFAGRLNRKPFVIILLWAMVAQVAVFTPLFGTQARMADKPTGLIRLYEEKTSRFSPASLNDTLPLRIKMEQEYFLWDYMTWLVLFILILPPLVRRAQDIGLPGATVAVLPGAIVLEAGWALASYRDILATDNPGALLGAVPFVVKYFSIIAVLYLAALVVVRGTKGGNRYGPSPVHHASPMESVVAELSEKEKGKAVNEVV